MVPDRYSSIGWRGTMLHRTRTFTEPDLAGFGGNLAAAGEAQQRRAAADLPNCEMLRERLVALPAYTRVSPRYVHQVGRAIRKVAEAAARITDLKRGV